MVPEDRRRGTGRILRNENHRIIPHSRTSYYQRSFIPDTSRHWNQLPHEVRSCKESKKFKKHIKLLHSTPQPSHYFTLGTKVGNTLHTQIRLVMSKLNTHQYSIQKTASPSCACGYKQENTKHFILHCPRFASARSELFSQVSTHLNTDFRTLSDDTKIDTLLKGSMPPSIDHMELLVWMQRADFSEHSQGFKSPGEPLNSSHFDAPNTKSALTGYGRAPNIISHHYKQELLAKASIVPKARPIRFR